MIYQRIPTKKFKKDVRRLQKSGADLNKLGNAIDILSTGQSLPATYNDHALKGAMTGARACHVGPDWLLVYAKDHDNLILLLLRTGTHRDTLGIE